MLTKASAVVGGSTKLQQSKELKTNLKISVNHRSGRERNKFLNFEKVFRFMHDWNRVKRRLRIGEIHNFS